MKIAKILTTVSAFLKKLKSNAEQLAQGDIWSLILSAAFRYFLGGKVLGSPGRLDEAIDAYRRGLAIRRAAQGISLEEIEL